MILEEGKDRPLGSHGGKERHWLVSGALSPTLSERGEFVAFVGDRCYSLDHFPIDQVELAQTYPYQALIPVLDDGLVIDRVNARPIVSAVKGGAVVRSIPYDKEPTEMELIRLASTLEVPGVLTELAAYAVPPTTATCFYERDEFDEAATACRRYRTVALTAVIAALALVGLLGWEQWQAWRLQAEIKAIQARVDRLTQEKRMLDQQLNRPGLSAEEEVRAEALIRDLAALYPLPVEGVDAEGIRIRLPHPELAKEFPTGQLTTPKTVFVPLSALKAKVDLAPAEGDEPRVR